LIKRYNAVAHKWVFYLAYLRYTRMSERKHERQPYAV